MALFQRLRVKKNFLFFNFKLYQSLFSCFSYRVREISEGSVQDPNAYILFYQLRSSSWIEANYDHQTSTTTTNKTIKYLNTPNHQYRTNNNGLLKQYYDSSLFSFLINHNNNGNNTGNQTRHKTTTRRRALLMEAFYCFVLIVCFVLSIIIIVYSNLSS